MNKQFTDVEILVNLEEEDKMEEHEMLPYRPD